MQNFRSKLWAEKKEQKLVLDFGHNIEIGKSRYLRISNKCAWRLPKPPSLPLVHMLHTLILAAAHPLALSLYFTTCSAMMIQF